MKPEEAIKAIKSNMPTKGTYTILTEALELAIQALEKQMEKNPTTVTERSNVIQYDSMGYSLRLVITNKGEQMRLDGYHEKEDVVLKWSEVEGLK